MCNPEQEETLMLGKIEGKRRSGQQRMRWLNDIINSVDMNLSKLQEIVEDREAWLLHPMGSQSWTRQLPNNSNNKPWKLLKPAIFKRGPQTAAATSAGNFGNEDLRAAPDLLNQIPQGKESIIRVLSSPIGNFNAYQTIENHWLKLSTLSLLIYKRRVVLLRLLRLF